MSTEESTQGSVRQPKGAPKPKAKPDATRAAGKAPDPAVKVLPPEKEKVTPKVHTPGPDAEKGEGAGKENPKPRESAGKDKHKHHGDPGKDNPKPREDAGKENPKPREDAGKEDPKPREDAGKENPKPREDAAKKSPSRREGAGEKNPSHHASARNKSPKHHKSARNKSSSPRKDKRSPSPRKGADDNRRSRRGDPGDNTRSRRKFTGDNSPSPSFGSPAVGEVQATTEKQPKLHYTELLRHRISIQNVLIRNLLSEFFATAILRFIGTGVVAQFVLSRGTYNAAVQVNLGWGFAICLAVYSAWRTSGGHVNPCVTAALYVLGKISIVHSLLYCVAQILGAAFGAALAFGVYYQAINDFDGGVRQLEGPNATASIFAAFPQPYLSNFGGFIDQLAGPGLLGLFVAYFCEPRNQVPSYLQPGLFGVVAAMLGTCYSYNMASPSNPACDFGPRVFAAMAGYGIEMMTYHDCFFWVPLIGPMFGGVLGAYSYLFFIGLHVPDPPPVETTPVEGEKIILVNADGTETKLP